MKKGSALRAGAPRRKHQPTKKQSAIMAIQAMGYRVLVRMAGGVDVWHRSAPAKVSTFPDLGRALKALRAVEGR